MNTVTNTPSTHASPDHLSKTVIKAKNLVLAVPGSLTVTILAIALAIVPAWSADLEFHRAAILVGERGRLFTGHLVHWTADHATWDILMFFALGALCELTWPGRFYLCLFVAAATISATIWMFLPEMTVYRGLSGIDTALFTLAGCGYGAEALAQRHRGVATIMVLFICGLAAKILYEVTTGDTLFVDSTSAFVPLPLAHLAGGIVGASVAIGGHVLDRFPGPREEKPRRTLVDR